MKINNIPVTLTKKPFWHDYHALTIPSVDALRETGMKVKYGAVIVEGFIFNPYTKVSTQYIRTDIKLDTE